ncbi:FMN-dependent NADH-azoreductase [Niastella vici]|uniref:FMN dependent NADH:quinone oxidoreductase n=1 Tax=Niastella vici TaxID=1703345 RepID=A0A1V9FN09_9BACT|nr:NAD(P)H-dependent oxidoreductase [Niastella vici]OQP59718.1 FMN-dependent NADH-azoreductase [Niastella vici]
MKKILNIVSSAKGDQSFSNKLSGVIIDKLLTLYPGSEIRTRNLAAEPLPYWHGQQIAAHYTPADQRTADHKDVLSKSDQAINELLDADFIVIGVPLYNFGIPSILKSWIDHIARSGVTFSYGDGAPKGLVTGKKVYLAIASGGIYSDGPMKAFDSTEPFLRNVLGFLGMTDITTFRVEGTGMPQLAEMALPKAKQAVQEFAF